MKAKDAQFDDPQLQVRPRMVKFMLQWVKEYPGDFSREETVQLAEEFPATALATAPTSTCRRKATTRPLS